MNDRFLLRIGAVGSAVAVLMLLVMAVTPWPFSKAPVEEVLLGRAALTSGAVDHLRMHMVIDGVFIVGWFVGWLGIAALVRTRARLVGDVTLVLGLTGAFLDFVETEIMWALIQDYQLGAPAQPGWAVAWQVARQLSYLLPYAAAAVAGMGLWSRKPLDRAVCVAGTVLAIPAVVGLYVPALNLLAGLWFLVWFACVGLLLWRRAGEWSSVDEH